MLPGRTPTPGLVLLPPLLNSDLSGCPIWSAPPPGCGCSLARGKPRPHFPLRAVGNLRLWSFMLMAVGSPSGIACIDACVGVANRIRTNGRRPFAELWALLTGEGYCTSAFFLKFTHSLAEIAEKLRQFNAKDQWLAEHSTPGTQVCKKLWCVYVDEIPGHASKDTYQHKIAEYIPSLKVFRLGLFHFLQRYDVDAPSSCAHSCLLHA